MKLFYSLIFVLFSVAALAQQHEFQLEYQPFKKEELGKGGSAKYYFNLSSSFAIGLKGSYYFDKSEDFYFFLEKQAYSFDLVHRKSFYPAKNFRVYGELGGAYTNEYYNNRYQDDQFFIGCGVGVNFPIYLHQGPIRINRLGVTGAAGMDYAFFNKLLLGASYTAKTYLLDDREDATKNKSAPLLNFYLGYKF